MNYFLNTYIYWINQIIKIENKYVFNLYCTGICFTLITFKKLDGVCIFVYKLPYFTQLKDNHL